MDERFYSAGIERWSVMSDEEIDKVFRMMHKIGYELQREFWDNLGDKIERTKMVNCPYLYLWNEPNEMQTYERRRVGVEIDDDCSNEQLQRYINELISCFKKALECSHCTQFYELSLTGSRADWPPNDILRFVIIVSAYFKEVDENDIDE